MIHYKDFMNEQKHPITSNTIIVLDVEVSSFWIDEGCNIREYDNTIPDETYNRWDKGCITYIWMVGIENKIFYGRELQELKDFLQVIEDFATLDKDEMLYCYIHNLSYEFSTCLINILDIDTVFAREERKPMKCTSGIWEFRCSYYLTQLSLASWGKQLGIQKMVGDLDYNKLYTPYTKLSDKELNYCRHDILIMLAGLYKYREQYGSIEKIPLTGTGEVRREVQALFSNNNKWHFNVTRQQPKDRNEYAIRRSIFGGGDCHTNVCHANELLYNVGSYDIASDYPHKLFLKYPSRHFMITHDPANKWNFEKYAYIFHIQLYDVNVNGNLSYLARSRVKAIHNGKYDNGRIISADFIDLWCTEQEYPFIKKLYTIGTFEVKKVYKSYKKHLPVDFLMLILDYYNKKTLLKGAKTTEEIDLYFQSKKKLNSLYGLTVTDIIMNEVTFDKNKDIIWSEEERNVDLLNQRLQEIQEKWWKNNLPYDVGIWCTAYARAELWNMLIKVQDNSDNEAGDVCYYDTDSCKILNPEKHKILFDERNKEIVEELDNICISLDIDPELTRPLFKNKKYQLGIWDYEGLYEEAKFLGAKKYCYQEDNELHITVSGVPKNAASCLNCVDDFKPGIIFDREVCKKNQTTYIDGNNYKGKLPDGYYLNQPYGINIRNCGYTLDITHEFKEYIRVMRCKL